MAVDSLQEFYTKVPATGGEVFMAWTLPTALPDHWQLYVFKKAGQAPTDQQIADYFAGELSDSQLAELGLFVFRTLRQDWTHITDWRVENGKTYYYRAVVKDTALDGEYSLPKNANATPSAELLINVVDGKTLVVLAVEKAIDALKTSQGNKPIVPNNIQVFKSHGKRKDEDFFVVVSRGPGQNTERYFSSIIAEFGEDVVKGEVDLDQFQVEWIAMNDPARRDHFTDLMRVMRVAMRRYIMRMGNGSVRDVRFSMGGDSEGQYRGAESVRGSMSVVLVIEQQMQTTGDNLAEWTINNTQYY